MKKEIDMLSKRLLRPALATWLLLASSAFGADAPVETVRQILMAQFDRPEARLTVAPVVVSGDTAVAGWAQAERGGRALLFRQDGQWRIVLCAGDALKDPRVLQEAGVKARDAQAIARTLAAAEAKLTSAHRARLASFDGIVRMDTGGVHPPSHKP